MAPDDLYVPPELTDGMNQERLREIERSCLRRAWFMLATREGVEDALIKLTRDTASMDFYTRQIERLPGPGLRPASVSDALRAALLLRWIEYRDASHKWAALFKEARDAAESLSRQGEQ
ncbi:hypothetical protein [Longimycelium tulufanense]|uniref:hypothetical protein n=1 Tax=Longimycelium tulufanense TaxID=907463 RepID=UPI0016661B8A|nr:hypothetical protein [Longimycelium tulufanense]